MKNKRDYGVMVKLKKIYDVKFMGKAGRKPRTDKSPISEYRSYLENCIKRGISREIMFNVITANDDRFANYDINKLNLYCSRMFKRIPITEDVAPPYDTNEHNFQLILPSFFIFLCLFFTPIHIKAEGANYYNNIETNNERSLFMKDDFYTNTNSLALEDYFSYRKPIVNASYNLEKGKILSSLLGTQNDINGGNIQMFQIKAKNSIFLLRKLVKQQEIYNENNSLHIKDNTIQ